MTTLVTAVIEGRLREAAEIVRADPAAAVAVDEERGWPPLLYLCYSRLHRIEPGRAPEMAELARILLAAGASPNTNDGGRPNLHAALKGAVEVDNPAVTEVLLDAGAHPGVGRPIDVAVGHRDPRCLRLLLDALGDGATAKATDLLPDAAADASPEVVGALLDAGADPGATDSDGVSAVRRAVRAGKPGPAARLCDLGATDDATDVDRFIGACFTGDRQAAERLLADHPDLLDRLGDHEQPLHEAAYQGNAPIVRLLLDAGADVDARDMRFDGTPLAFATVGSGEQAGEPGDWVTTVRLLLDAGASRQGVWIPAKPPSAEVAELLERQGITPDEPSSPEPSPPVMPGTGAMADLARNLETAYRDRDLDLLGSLLHPQVSWTGSCRNREQVLDWYRGLHDSGTVAAVRGAEVDRDAVILELTVTGTADGARPAPAQRVWQVFTVRDALIVDIRGYPDRAGAVGRY